MSQTTPEAPRTPSIPRDKKPSRLALWGRLFGALGAVLCCSTPLTYLLAGWGPLATTKLVLGLVLLVAYVATNPDFFARKSDRRAQGLLTLSLGSGVLLAALLALVNYQVALHPKEFDCTREKLYTLGPQTLETLAKLDTPVSIYAFFRSDEELFGLVQSQLTRYSQHSDKLTVQMVNPLSRPDLVKKYQITERSPRIVIVGQGKDARAKSVDEEDLTNGILKAVQQGHQSVHFLSGHGEGDLKEAGDAEGFAALARAIEADGYEILPINLLQSGPEEGTDDARAGHRRLTQEAQSLEVPESVRLLAILSPQHRLLQPELMAIERFLARGGRLLVFEEAQVESGLKELLAHYNVVVQDDLIVDTNPVGRLLGLGVASPLIQPTSAGHAITRGLSGMVMKTARSLTLGKAGNERSVAVPLAETGSTAWGETQLKQGATIARDEHDHDPPLYTAMAVDCPLDAPAQSGNEPAAPASSTKKSARLVVFGDSDWVSNGLIGLQSNEDLALNALGWLLEESDRITIRPRTRAHSLLALSGDDLNKLKFFSMDLLPVLLVALGFGIVVARRQR